MASSSCAVVEVGDVVRRSALVKFCELIVCTGSTIARMRSKLVVGRVEAGGQGRAAEQEDVGVSQLQCNERQNASREELAVRSSARRRISDREPQHEADRSAEQQHEERSLDE